MKRIFFLNNCSCFVFTPVSLVQGVIDDAMICTCPNSRKTSVCKMNVVFSYSV